MKRKIKLFKDGRFDISAATLHIIAMSLMLMDHLWATLLPAQDWLTCAGRAAFPIFAFMTVEGYFYTHNLKDYIFRLFFLALFSEIPFDLMCEGTWFYPFHQNVIWTFLIGIAGIHLMEKLRKNKWTDVLSVMMIVLTGMLIGTVCMVDYYGAGVLTVFGFYLFRGRKLNCLAGQFFILYFVNTKLLGGLIYPVYILGMRFDFMQQGFAILALIPIWLYRDRQGYHSKFFQYSCYLFYPIHMFLLTWITMFL